MRISASGGFRGLAILLSAVAGVSAVAPDAVVEGLTHAVPTFLAPAAALSLTLLTAVGRSKK
jgi:hypothetical protein